MAKKNMIEREKSALNYIKNMKRASLLKRIKRLQYKTKLHSNTTTTTSYSSKTRIRNRCWKTGRPVVSSEILGLSRHVFREMAHQCLLPGVTKSSW
jgi:small subunit ribosomal protein S14